MTLPVPFAGLVIRYSYLWGYEAKAGAQEGRKDRPCAIILLTRDEDGKNEITVLPVTHSPPTGDNRAIEIPMQIKKRLQLDDQRSWVVLTEANRFIWPGYDLRPSKVGDPSTIAIGALPYKFYEQIRLGFLQAVKKGGVSITARTD